MTNKEDIHHPQPKWGEFLRKTEKAGAK